MALLFVFTTLLLVSRFAEIGGTTNFCTACSPLLFIFLLRPEMGLEMIISIFGIAAYLAYQNSFLHSKRLVCLALSSSSLVGLVTLFRLSITRILLPQSVVSKTGNTNFVPGILYLLRNITNTWVPFLILSLLLILLDTNFGDLSPSQIFVLIFALLNMSGVVVSGGDWMECGRFLLALLCFFLIFLLSIRLHKLGGCLKLLYVLIFIGQIITISFWITHAERFEITGSLLFDKWRTDITGQQYASGFVVSRNQVHLRGSYFLSKVIPYLRFELKNSRVPLTIGSPQGGMVLYYLKEKFGDSIRFVDMNGLVTSNYKQCKIRSTSAGRHVSWQQFDEFSNICGPKPPDFLFDLGNFPTEIVSSYSPKVEIRGEIFYRYAVTSGSQWLAKRINQ